MNISLVRLDREVPLPSYAHPVDVGLDMYTKEAGIVPARGMQMFYCGFAIAFDEGYAAIVKDKSSLSCKLGLHCIGGVFDAGYRGEYNVMLVNLTDSPVTIERHQKVAQLVIIPIIRATFNEVQELPQSE